MQRNRDAMIALRALWKAAGKCSRCGGHTDAEHATCAICRFYVKAHKCGIAVSRVDIAQIVAHTST